MKKIVGIVTSVVLFSSCSITSQPISDPMARMPSTVSMPTASVAANATIRPSQTSTTPSQTLVSEKIIKNPLTNNTITLKHMCNGNLENILNNAFEYAFTPACKGKNILTLSNNALDKVIAESTSTAQGATAALIDTVVVGTGNQTRLLISFPRDYCSFSEQRCGADGPGYPDNQITESYDLTTSLVRSIKNYPTHGVPVWNKSNTKALFLSRTCGGAGCIAAPIIGYDLLKDVQKNVTTDKAADRMGAKDVSGKALAYWQDLRWVDDTNFVVTLVGVDGKKKEVKGSL